ncbi:MAG: hypothetical protein ACYC0Y_26130, partial [Pirellulales bacterium]
MLFDFDHLAAWLGTDAPTALALLEAGALPPPVTIGGRLLRWSETSLQKWVANGCRAGERPTQADFVSWRVLLVDENLQREIAAGLVVSPEQAAQRLAAFDAEQARLAALDPNADEKENAYLDRRYGKSGATV